MKYYATINKRVHYIKIYKILKKVSGDTNQFSKMFQRLINKYVLKKNVE